MSNLANYEEFIQAVANQDIAKAKIALDELLDARQAKSITREKLETEIIKSEKHLEDKLVTKKEFKNFQEQIKTYFYILVAILLLKGDQSVLEIIKSVF